MTLPAWGPALAAARADARLSGDDEDAAAARAWSFWLRDVVAAALDLPPIQGVNVALNDGAFDLGRLVAAGALDYGDTLAALVDAAVRVGESRPRATATAKSGLRAGAQKPVGLPALGTLPPLAPVGPVARTAPPPEPAPVRLPPDEVAALWGAARSVLDDPRALRWFNARAPLGPPAALRVADLDLARCLPLGAKCPPWARCRGRTWAEGWPLLLPWFDARGDLVGLYARRVATTWNEAAGRWEEIRDPLEPLKQVSPAGVHGVSRGTVYACPVGRWLLRRGAAARPGDLVDGLTPATTWSGAVLVVEGGPAWLRYAAELPDDGGQGRAVLGMQSGSWPDADAGRALAARIPDGARVVVAPDPDVNGERYADKMLSTFAGRAVTLLRLPPEDTGDENEAACA